MMNVLFLVPISKETKIQDRPISQKVKRSQKSRAQFFTALHSNKVMSKITVKFCGLLELKLEVGNKIYQM